MERFDASAGGEQQTVGVDQDLVSLVFWGLATTSLILSTLLAGELWTGN
ncbi:MAG: hypothetical protein HQL95_16020 [Magnetococcales bacterium]|nr:hypothetical protein [Magnetococcales bacterium]